MAEHQTTGSDGPLARGLAVELRGIEKSFGGVRALGGTDLEVRQGEILGLCGENGAGKSTLIKILAGVHPHSSYRGTVKVHGARQRFDKPADATRAGIAVVHQELMLVPELSVAQNLFLGREPRRFGLVDDARLEVMARAELARFGFAAIDPSKVIAELGIGLQQVVEIIRALSQNARILILDEPTAALTRTETDELLEWLRRLRAEGTTAIYVSHRLDEVFAVCDRISVLRDGRHVATVATSESSPDAIVSLMVGRSVGAFGRSRIPRPERGTPALELRGFGVVRREDVGGTSHAQHVRRFVVEDVSLELQPGEVAAVCGAMGAGRTALLSGIFGSALAGTTGSVLVHGQPVQLSSPRAAIAAGLAFVPEDRRGRGLVTGMTVAENLALPTLASAEVMGAGARLGLVDGDRETALAERRIRELGIRGRPDAAVATLSGGNQQKVVLGKWLERPPRVLLLDEPTRGVDVGAREEIYAILERLAQSGVAILFASSDLTEVIRLAHRVIVLRQGRTVGELPGTSVTEETIVQLSTGARSADQPRDGNALGQP